RTGHQTHVADHQRERNNRRYGKRPVDGDVVYQVSHQQVKRKKCRSQEEIIHGMQIYAPDGGDNEYQEKEEKQRYRSKKADAPGQGSGLEFFRHDHPDLVAGEQVFVIPVQLPAVGGLLLLARGERVIWEIDVLEVCKHGELKVAHVGNLIAEFVTPALHALGSVAYLQNRGFSRAYSLRCQDGVSFIPELHRCAIEGEHHVVIDCLFRGKGKAESNIPVLCRIVAERVFSGEVDFVRAIPKQALLAVLKVERGVGARGFQRQVDHSPDRYQSGLDLPLVVFGLLLFLGDALPGGARWRLHLGRTPRRGHSGAQAAVLVIGALEDGCAQNHPGDGGKDENDDKSEYTFGCGHKLVGSCRRREYQHDPSPARVSTKNAARQTAWFSAAADFPRQSTPAPTQGSPAHRKPA